MYTIIDVPDQHKTQQLYEKVIAKIPEMLKFGPNCYKTQEMHEKAVDYCCRVSEYVPDYYMNQEMHEKAIDTYPSALMHASNQFKTQKMC